MTSARRSLSLMQATLPAAAAPAAASAAAAAREAAAAAAGPLTGGASAEPKPAREVADRRARDGPEPRSPPGLIQ